MLGLRPKRLGHGAEIAQAAPGVGLQHVADKIADVPRHRIGRILLPKLAEGGMRRQLATPNLRDHLAERVHVSRRIDHPTRHLFWRHVRRRSE